MKSGINVMIFPSFHFHFVLHCRGLGRNWQMCKWEKKEINSMSDKQQLNRYYTHFLGIFIVPSPFAIQLLSWCARGAIQSIVLTAKFTGKIACGKSEKTFFSESGQTEWDGVRHGASAGLLRQVALYNTHRGVCECISRFPPLHNADTRPWCGVPNANTNDIWCRM